jgi:ankyrin repeat protein
MSDEEDNDLLAPLPSASSGLDLATVSAIMEAKANNPSQFASYWEMDEQDINEATPEEIQKSPVLKILWAAEKNEVKVMEELVRENPSLVNCCDEDGYTPLHRSAYEGNVDAMKFLLAHGADIHALTIDGWTALHSAANWGQVETVSFLLHHGCRVNAQTKGKQTALHLSVANSQSFETIQVLLMHPDIDWTLVNGQGETAAQMAERTPFLELFEMCHDAVNFLRPKDGEE